LGSYYLPTNKVSRKEENMSRDSYYTTLKRIDDLGRIQIPRNVRELLDIQEGEELELSVNSFYKEITIKKVNI
jgi:AbrB family looped-hinge helix DNA binding protein